MDLSIVPNDMLFDGSPVSQCTKAPRDYVPLTAFRKSKFEPEWDETNPRRLALTHKKAFTEDDLENLERYDYLLAPPSDEDDVEKYSTFKGNVSCSSSEEQIDIEWTDSVNCSPDPPSVTPTPHAHNQTTQPFKDPFLTSKPPKSRFLKTKKPKYQPTSQTNEAEYELLTLDLKDETQRHFDYYQEIKEKKQSFKKRMKNSIKSKNKLASDFQPNLNDQRFSALFDSPNFSIDPSSSQYKPTDSMQKIITLQTKKRKKLL